MLAAAKVTKIASATAIVFSLHWATVASKSHRRNPALHQTTPSRHWTDVETAEVKVGVAEAMAIFVFVAVPLVPVPAVPAVTRTFFSLEMSWPFLEETHSHDDVPVGPVVPFVLVVSADADVFVSSLYFSLCTLDKTCLTRRAVSDHRRGP